MVNVNLFSQLLALIPREKFDKLVKKHESNKHSKAINSWTHFVSMIFCQLGGASSVRDISNGLMSTTGNIKHLVVNRVYCKYSLSYINAHRSHELFKDVYFSLLEHLQSTNTFARKGLLRLKLKIYLLEASIIPLCREMYDWARYRSTKGAVKLHALLDYDGLMPVFAQITDGSTQEITIARQIPFPKGRVVVVDRGYLDYSWLFKLDSTGYFFVTRTKTSTDYTAIQNYPVTDNVLSDQCIVFRKEKAKRDYPGKVRIVRYLDSITNNECTFLTNNVRWKAQTVANIYKERWQIEIFFKQLKQNMRIKSFVGTTEYVVQI